MRRNGYLWTFGVNLDAAVRFADPDFLSECKISAIWRHFPLMFAFYAECLPYFYFRVVWPIDLKSIPHASTPTSIIPTKFEVDMTINSQGMRFCMLIRHVSLTFDLEQTSHMASHVTNLATKYEDPTPIRSRVMSYNVSRWFPLKMRTRPLRMCRIMWPVSRVS